MASRSYTPSTDPLSRVWMRTAWLTVAISLLALPVSVSAEGAKSVDSVAAVLVAPVVAPAYVWDGRLATSYVAPVVAPAYVWDGRLATSYVAPVVAPAEV